AVRGSASRAGDESVAAAGEDEVRSARSARGIIASGNRRPYVFPQNAHYSDSTLSEIRIYRAKSEGHSRPLNHRKSDSYAAPAAQRRSAGAGISHLERRPPRPIPGSSPWRRLEPEHRPI